MSSKELESNGSAQSDTNIASNTTPSKLSSSDTNHFESPMKKIKLEVGSAQTTPVTTSLEGHSDTNSTLYQRSTSQVEAKDAGIDSLIVVRLTACYESMPDEVKVMILKYLLKWRPKSRRIPKCVRGLCAEDIFYNKCYFELPSVQRPAKMPDHVFEQIQNIAVRYPLIYESREGDVLDDTDKFPRLRCLHIYQSRHFLARNVYIYSLLQKTLKIHNKVEEILLTFRGESSADFRYSRDYAVRTCNAALGLDGFWEVIKNEGTDETWSWKAAPGNFLQWSSYYPTVL